MAKEDYKELMRGPSNNLNKKQKQKVLLDGLNLKVGDRIKLFYIRNEVYILKVAENDYDYYLRNDDDNNPFAWPVEYLITYKYNKLRKKEMKEND